ncbi:MAG: cytochrome B [Erysipelotrichaceae bacterium]|nr:cytochrome B [Erysipelotrichaceae bacterium]MDY5251544.1 cytochrome B [Erysipelotrichaceae bacterium]
MNKLRVYDLCLIALLASLEYVIFISFSNILYLELITFVICLFAVSFKPQVTFLASLIFALIMLVFNGVNFWNLMYLVIYPSYSLLVGSLRRWYQRYPWALFITCGFLSFLTGQLLQLPFILFSKKLTVLYLLIGLKTSLLQGAISMIACSLLFKPCYKVLTKMRSKHEKNND